MATLLQIHADSVRETFDNAPKLLAPSRQVLFDLPAWAETVSSQFHSDSSRLGFILQLGYFQATHRFFPIGKFHQEDIRYVIDRFLLQLEPEELGAYSTTTHWRHQELILQQLGFQRFSETHQKKLTEEALRLGTIHMRPDALFDYLLCFLEERRIEIPSYHTLAQIITGALQKVERGWAEQIERLITPEEQSRLDELLKNTPPFQDKDQPSPGVKRYRLTYLKHISQSLKTGSIEERVEHFEYLQKLFKTLAPLAKRLQLPDQTLHYLAQYVLKAQPAQLYRRDNRRYLYLVGFIVHQYREWTDALVDTLLQSVSHFFSQCEERLKEQYYENREEAGKLTQAVTDQSREHLKALTQIRQVVKKTGDDRDSKLVAIEQLIDQYLPNEETLNSLQKQLGELEKINGRYHHQEAYYDWLNQHSIRLQRKVSALICLLPLDEATSGKDIVAALNYYRTHKDLTGNPPTNFLTLIQQGKVLDEKGSLRVSLYKVLLFYHATLRIKSGRLNLLHSYRYRAFESYLISKERWLRERASLLERANLTDFSDGASVLATLGKQLHGQLVTTNERILKGENIHATRKKDGKLVVDTPKTATDKLLDPYELFPSNKVISLQEVLATVNALTGYTDALTHWQSKYIPKRPAKSLFLAGLMALGCNVGVRRMAQITRSVSEKGLDEVVKWYFSNENLRKANDRIVDYTKQLKLRIHLKDDPNLTYTSSDGQKVEVAQDSLLARSSFKYFGNRKGVTAYNYTDDTLLLFDSLVFSAGDREATYLLNGLVKTHLVDSDVHSTDSHGATELTFAATHLLGIRFEPRIKNFLRQQLYSIEPLSRYKDLTYPVLPNGRINIERIMEQWDAILRLMTTIRLHHSGPSDLFNRLNSYASENPLYRGMKEFGRLIKSIFLVRYIDNVAMRQRVHRQLNRSESIHQLVKSVWFGRHGQMGWVSRGDQEVAETAKRVILNSIVCYNYLHLSDHISRIVDWEERRAFINRLSKLIVLTHHHINFIGIYDFSDELHSDNILFDLEGIKGLEL